MTVRVGESAVRVTRQGAMDLVLVAVFAVITVALGWPPVRRMDLAVRDAADAHRPYVADLIAQNLNRLGSGGLLTFGCLAVAAVVGVRRRSWLPFAPVVAAFLLTGAVIQPLKVLLDRPAPHAPLPDELAVRLFAQPDGLSFPSGHAVNTVVWYAVLGLLLAPWLSRTAALWLRLAPPVIVTAAGTYLGYHWLTDMLAGLALGLPMAHLLSRLPWPSGARKSHAKNLDAGG